MIEFKRNKETGVLEVYKNGNKLGIIKAMQEMETNVKSLKGTVTQINNNNRVITVDRR